MNALLGAWGDLFRRDSFHAIAFVVASAAPSLGLDDQLVIAKLGAWVCAFDDYADHATTDASELAMRVDQYVGILVDRDCPELAFDPIARLFTDVIEALREAPAADTLWPLFSSQIRASLNAMKWEQTVARHHENVDFDEYLRYASDSSCVRPIVTAAAMLLHEEELVVHLPRVLVAQQHASIAVRMANDCASSLREQNESAANALSLFCETDRDALMSRAEREVVDLRTCLSRLPSSVSSIAYFLERFTVLLLNCYRCGDLGELRAVA